MSPKFVIWEYSTHRGTYLKRSFGAIHQFVYVSSINRPNLILAQDTFHVIPEILIRILPNSLVRSFEFFQFAQALDIEQALSLNESYHVARTYHTLQLVFRSIDFNEK